MARRAQELASNGYPRVRVITASPAGTVRTPTSARFIEWAHLDSVPGALVSAAAAAAPIVQLLKSDAPDARDTNPDVDAASRSPIAPAWAIELHARAGSLEAFIKACVAVGR